MNDEQKEPTYRQEPEPKTADTSITPSKSPRSYKLSRKHKRFADAYLLTLNASEAYRAVFKPKCPEYAYKNAYKVLRIEGVARYIDEALADSTDEDYKPEAIKQGIRQLAMTAKRESDRLRAYELMSKISGLLTENVNNTQVNFVTDEIMQLAKKRILSKGSQVVDNEALTEKPSEPFTAHNAHYRTLDGTDAQTNPGLMQEKDSPPGDGVEGPPPTPESNSNTSP